MRIGKRWLLCLIIAGAQCVCISLGVVWFAHWVELRIGDTVLVQMRAMIGSLAEYSGRLIDESDLSDISPGTDGWERIRRIVADFRLPNEGKLSVISATDGSLICHPDCEPQPCLAHPRPGLALLRGEGEERRIIDVSCVGRAVATGWIEAPGGRVLLAAVRDLPAQRAKLLVTQDAEKAIQAAVRLVQPMRAMGLAAAAIFMLFDILLTMAIVQRYEDKLAAANDNLENLVHQRTQALVRTRDAVIFGLAKLAESRDDETGSHLERICAYVQILGDELALTRADLDAETVRVYGVASSLHDIGKVGLPDSILMKAGPLSDVERRDMQKHTLIGGECLLALRNRLGNDAFIDAACEIAFAHHERWDGTGYPFGVEGENIPLSARIVALADVYDALTSRRVYKPSMTHAQAAEMIVAESGRHFDPAVVRAFQRRQTEFRAIAESHWHTDAPRPITDAPPQDAMKSAAAMACVYHI